MIVSAGLIARKLNSIAWVCHHCRTLLSEYSDVRGPQGLICLNLQGFAAGEMIEDEAGRRGARGQVDFAQGSRRGLDEQSIFMWSFSVAKFRVR